jgi:hypothetical protein
MNARWTPMAPLLAVGVLVSACSPAIASPSTTHTASHAAPESPSVPSSPSAPEGPSAPAGSTTEPAESLVEVAVDVLTIGPPPGGVADQGIAVLAGAVAEGTRLWILEEGDGVMLVAALGFFEDEMPIGWAPASEAGAPTVRPVDLACPLPPLTVEQLAGLGSMGGLACYGDASIGLIGFSPVGCGVGGSPRTGEPDWLNGTWSGISIGNEEPMPPDFEVAHGITGHVPPGAEVPGGCGEAGWYRYAGHFDDPASLTCRTEIAEAQVIVVEPVVSQLICRDKLVLESGARLPGAP